MDDTLDRYTASEFLSWLSDETADEYIEQSVEALGNETIIIETFDIDSLKNNFIRSRNKFMSVKRGHKFYIHDNEKCQDIMQFRFNAENYEEIQNEVSELVELLNTRNVSFIGKKHHCM